MFLRVTALAETVSLAEFTAPVMKEVRKKWKNHSENFTGIQHLIVLIAFRYNG
jgi:hypothetical protein